MPAYTLQNGSPDPLGTSRQGSLTNFALYSPGNNTITLCLYNPKSSIPFFRKTLDNKENRTGDIWHIAIDALPSHFEYGYLINTSLNNNSLNLKERALIDPYAKVLMSSSRWGDHESCSYIPNNFYPCRAVGFYPETPFDWENDSPPDIHPEDLVIYEMHIRGFTQHPTSNSKYRGKFLGVIDRINHLKQLGINAVEILPIYEFNELEYRKQNPLTYQRLYNFWGYSPVNFFSPMNRYATSNDPGIAINEFKTMVKALHREGIEVYLDVVYNHTCEGGGPHKAISFKGIDKKTYYMLDARRHLLDFTGCGNTFNANNPVAMKVVLDSLRYWVTEMHVDGFRFDLASTFQRGQSGEVLADPPIFKAIEEDPILSKVKLIAEPWDAVGMYQVGSYGGPGSRWMEWNGKYRDTLRCFLKSTPGLTGAFAGALAGSEELYGNGRRPTNSINFITCHDGFTLADLISYNDKHNIENGEDNRDGNNSNDSWNHGEEGQARKKEVKEVRRRQMRNYFLALMLSQGAPMIFMGDEYGHTKNGNNNTWCHDNQKNYFLWDQLENQQELFRFFRQIIRFRKRHKLLRNREFLSSDDVSWYGVDGNPHGWGYESRFLGLLLKDIRNDNDLYAAFNADLNPVEIIVPAPPEGKTWYWIVNTSLAPPNDVVEDEMSQPLKSSAVGMNSFSSLLLKAL